MPLVKPFCALKPAKHLQASVVTRPLENYSAKEIKQIAAENPDSFLHLINPELDNPYLRGTKQELIYKKISENLESFIEHSILVKQDEPAIYVYRVIHDGLTQTGIWTLTHIADYLNGGIKKHESTVAQREKSLAEYLQQTGIDANPVLITYHSDAVIEALVNKYVGLGPELNFVLSDESRHQVWAITDEGDLTAVISAFATMPYVYIADGHHRIASMAKMGQHKQALNADKHTGREAYNYFTTVYMNTAEVKVLEFNRLVRDLGGLTVNEFVTLLDESFIVEKSLTDAITPLELHTIGMYLDRQWYRLIPKKGIYDEHDPVAVLDVSILQNFILDPLLKIQDPRANVRITFEGGRTSIADLQDKVDSGMYAVAFTLFPVSVDQVIAVADAKGVMPPKSTWVEPKFLTGLLTNYFN
ncbi:DUF1015 domain-containing protein [Pedobacter psychroterrae]|uniref:DUF1015 domain-containing protein n=1 Tax=Pedobacter psychroterrae TaxID=2530453 RepID=A0A4V2MLB3_9SPHI|nr:DUF1015 domain-containing protein [Pedobacter psychroterrae]TCD01427.1 DUF1015 domain-containing protein [Pedobacter psychroterrae]